MSLYKDPLAAVVDSVNRLNKLSLNQSEYDFALPVAITPYGDDINTSLTVTAKAGNGVYTGSVTVDYHRIDLAELDAQVTLEVAVNNPLTTLDIALAINKYFGTAFTAADIIVRDLTAEEKTLPGTVLLEASPNSYGWTGSVTVDTRLGGLLLGDYLLNRDLPGLNYPSPTTTKPYAHLYSYWRDFSAQYTALNTVQVGTAQLSAVRDALAAVTGDNWVLSGSSRYSLDGATVTVVTEPRLSQDYNDRYEFVVEVALSETYSLGLEGSLVLHFNAPIE